MGVQYVRAVLRKNGGVNLRNPWGCCLSEVQTLVWGPLLLLTLWMVWRVLAFIWLIIITPYEGGDMHISHIAGHNGAGDMSAQQSSF